MADVSDEIEREAWREECRWSHGPEDAERIIRLLDALEACEQREARLRGALNEAFDHIRKIDSHERICMACMSYAHDAMQLITDVLLGRAALEQP